MCGCLAARLGGWAVGYKYLRAVRPWTGAVGRGGRLNGWLVAGLLAEYLNSLAMTCRHGRMLGHGGLRGSPAGPQGDRVHVLLRTVDKYTCTCTSAASSAEYNPHSHPSITWHACMHKCIVHSTTGHVGLTRPNLQGRSCLEPRGAADPARLLAPRCVSRELCVLNPPT